MFAEQLRVLVVDHGGEVAAVVEDEVQGFAAGEEQGLLDAPIELLLGHAFPGVDGEARLGDGARGVVLGAEDVAATPGDLGAELGERLDEHRRLDGHVQAAGDAGAGERLGLAVLLPQGHQAGHFVLGELDFLPAPLGEPLELGGGAVEDFVRQTFGGNLGHGGGAPGVDG